MVSSLSFASESDRLCLFLHRHWQRYPALLYGLAFLLGLAFAATPSMALFIPLLVLWSPLLLGKACHSELRLRQLLALSVFAGGYLWVSLEVHYPDHDSVSLSDTPLAGTATFSLDSVKEKESHCGKAWVYSGTLKAFVPESSSCNIASKIPCQLYLPQKRNIHRPPANRDYIFQGRLKKTIDGRYSLLIAKEEPWKPVPGSFSLAESRYQWKQKLSSHLARHLPHPATRSFLTGLATGDFSDPLLTFELGRFGLQHILAISGFHFSVLAALLIFLLRLFLPPKAAAGGMIVLLTVYLLFLGFAPSIVRAWTAALLFFSGQLLERRSSALNSLGVGLLMTLLIDPLFCRHVGFQFSFLATAAILVLFRPVELQLSALFEKRPLCQLLKMNRIHQHGYLILTFLRNALSLTIAVHLAVVPVVLFHFHRFPWMSLLYNLFFPFLVSFSLFLLFLALLISFLWPPLASWIYLLNDAYTQWVLAFTFNLPPTTDFFLRGTPSLGWVIAYVTLLFLIAILNHEARREEGKEEGTWGFV